MIENFKYLIITIGIFLTFSSCRQSESEDINQNQKEVSFSFNGNGLFSANAKTLDDDISKIQISINDNNGTSYLTLEELNIFRFGDGHITEPVVMELGDYTITAFVVLNSAGETIYATPISGSSLEELVSQPLPIAFSVTEDEFTKVELEVIAINGGTPEDFGYTSFDFNVISPLRATISTFSLDTTVESGFSFLESDLVILGDGDTLYDNQLAPSFNLVFIDTLKEDGTPYASYSLQLSALGYYSYDSIFTHENFKTLEDTVLSIALDEIDLTEQLATYYSFDGNFDDQSDNELTTSNNGVVLDADRDGTPNSAALFTGSSYLEIAHDDTLNVSDKAFSVSFWMNSTSTQMQMIMEKGLPGLNPNMWIRIFDDVFVSLGEPVYEIVTLQGNGTGSSDLQKYDGDKIVDNTWLHIVFVRSNDGEKRIYSNNELIFTQTSVNQNANNSETLFIGRQRDFSDRFFQGNLDNFRFYRRELLNEEVRFLYEEYK